jgi:hypothetical protein
MKASKILKEISTHKAVKECNYINIYIKGFTLPESYPGANDSLSYKDELIDRLPLDREDDLFSIFENFEENNRVMVAEANAEFKSYFNNK